MECAVPSCDRNTVESRKYCEGHRKRLQTKGDVQEHVPLRSYVKGTIEERFWAYVNKTDECWLWTGATDPDGYGLMTGQTGETLKVHALSLQMHTGQVRDENSPLIRHSCGTRNCVNPSHLSLGDTIDNYNDGVMDGVYQRNEKGQFKAESW